MPCSNPPAMTIVRGLTRFCNGPPRNVPTSMRMPNSEYASVTSFDDQPCASMSGIL